MSFYYRLLLFSLVSILILAGLNAHPVQLWDESRNAVNAYEMYRDGFSLTTTFLDDGIDMWNTKPPLLIWIQVLFMHIFGVSEWALRLPSALAGICTCLLIARWVRIESGSRCGALLAAVILATTAGFNGHHVVRTGDYDALLVMWITLASYHFFYYIKNNQNRRLYFFFIFTSLAILTKGIAGVLFFPGILIYTIYSGSFLRLLKNPHLYTGAALCVIIAGAYYVSRESVNPGYMAQVYKNELGGRFSDSLEGQSHPFYYYLSTFNMPYWVVFLPLVFFAFYRLAKRLKGLAAYCVIFIISFLIVISSSDTKHVWYAASIYPFTAILLSLLLPQFLLHLLHKKFTVRYSYSLPIILSAICLAPLISTIKRNLDPPKNKSKANQLPLYIKNILEGSSPSDFSTFHVLTRDYSPNVLFYTFSKDINPNIMIKTIDDNDVRENIQILTNDHEVLRDIRERYNTRVYVEKEGLIHLSTLSSHTNPQ